MDELLPMLERAAPIYGLYLIRLSGFFLLVPVLGDEGVPREARFALILVLSVVLFCTRGFGTIDPIPDSWILASISEMAVGLWMGFVLRTLFEVVVLVGAILGFEMGFGFTATIDPINRQQSIVIATFYRYTAALVFLASGAVHAVLLSLIRSYDIVSIGEMGLTRFTDLAWQAASLFSVTLNIAIALVAPMMIVSFVLSVGIALLARVVQGFHVLEIGFPLRVLAGFGLVWLSLPHFLPALKALFEQMNSRLLAGLSGG